MLAEREISVRSLSRSARWHGFIAGGVFLAVALVASDEALSRGLLPSILLLVGMAMAGLCACILWRPGLGLYASVLLNLIADSQVAGDPISTYTAYFHEDLNTSVRAGIAFNPLELLLAVTIVAFLLQALVAGRRLRGGTLAPHVAIFALFLIVGYVHGITSGGDAKTGLFEIRAPAMLVLLYFLTVNLATEQRQVERLFGLVLAGIAILAIWGSLRYLIVFHGKSDGPDGAFGSIHENAIFLAFFAVVGLARLLLVRPRWRRLLPLLLVTVPGLVVMFEMQRRAAFLSLYLAMAMLAISLFVVRRRLFFAVVPVAAVLIVGYSAIFWNSSSVLAQPIRAWRSQTIDGALDARDYSSNIYRLEEKADVRATILSAPLSGIGFGRPFYDIASLPILSWWPFQFYTPHAEVLWIWLKVGAGGFVAFWVIVCTAILRVGALLRRDKMTERACISLMAAVFIVMLLGFAYVDVGLASQRCEVLLGVMLGIIGATSHMAGGGDTAHGANRREGAVP